ncbi:hypothetical protein U1Q18_037935 [Sarracenia purpurea var. burkii]
MLLKKSDLITCPSENHFRIDVDKNWKESSKVTELLNCLENIRRLGKKSKEEIKTIYLTDESSEFLFPNVLRDKYRLEVKHTSPEEVSGEEKWCWEKRFLDLDVATEDVKGISFVQKGYWVNIISTHDVDAYMTQSDGSHVNLKIKKGSQQICVESPGMHELHFVNSCILFGSTSTQIDTSNPSPIYLRGEKYPLKGQIHVNSSLLSGVDELPENMLVNIVNNEGMLLEGTTARLVTTGDDQASAAAYEYSVWTNPGEKLTFTPQDSRRLRLEVLYLSSATLVVGVPKQPGATTPLMFGP